MSESKPSRRILLLFGIPQILLGAGILLASCAAWTLRIATRISGKVPVDDPEGGTLVLVLGIWLVAGGIGILRGAKWGWILTLVLDTFFVVYGYYGAASALVWIPDLLRFSSGPETGAIRFLFGRWVSEFFFSSALATLGVLQAVALLLPGTRRLFDVLDPKSHWTDRCPLPVLLWCVYAGVGFLSGMLEFFNPDLRADFFGRELTGAPASALTAFNLAIIVWTTLGMYRLERASWVMVLVVDALWTLSGTLTLMNTSLAEHYRHSALAKETLALVPDPAFLAPWVLTLAPLLLTVGEFAYLFWIGCHFRKSTAY